MSMVRKLSFKDSLLGLANVKWGRGMILVNQARRWEFYKPAPYEPW